MVRGVSFGGTPFQLTPSHEFQKKYVCMTYMYKSTNSDFKLFENSSNIPCKLHCFWLLDFETFSFISSLLWMYQAVGCLSIYTALEWRVEFEYIYWCGKLPAYLPSYKWSITPLVQLRQNVTLASTKVSHFLRSLRHYSHFNHHFTAKMASFLPTWQTAGQFWTWGFFFEDIN